MRCEKVLLIERCSDHKKWYAGLVGQTVPLLAQEGNEWRSRQPDGYINYIALHEATPVYLQEDGGIRWKKPE